MRTLRYSLLLVTLTLAGLSLGAASGYAAAPAPGLVIHTLASPSHFSPADTPQCLAGLSSSSSPPCDMFQVTVTNAGEVAAEGPVKIVDVLPPGLEAKELKLQWSGNPEAEFGSRCEAEGSTVTCEFPLLRPDESLELQIMLVTEAGASAGVNTASVSEGGGEPVATTPTATVIGGDPPPFGPSSLTSEITGPDGRADVQAGDHPYEMNTRIDLNTVIGQGPETTGLRHTSVEDVKDVVLDLPIGFIGGALAAPKCTFAQLVTLTGCPEATRVGHIRTEPEGSASVNGGIYNMTPERGVAAEFGYVDALDNSHVIDASAVSTPEGYVLRASGIEVPQVALTDVVVTLFGDPAVKDGAGAAPTAMFTNPSDCSGQPLVTTVHMDSWEHPGSRGAGGTPEVGGLGWVAGNTTSPPVTGCNALRFAPQSFEAHPDVTGADSPAGLDFGLSVPQSEQPGTLAAPPLRNATVTLPVGVIVNPAAAGGLASCSLAQIGWLGRSVSDFTNAAPTCPDASKIGSVSLTTPLLSGTLTGTVYLAAQNENPFHSNLAGYIVVDDPTTGILVKIAGELTLDPGNGQITGTFDENPQLPFSSLQLHFFGGSQGELATPESCGTFTSSALLSPWSAPDSGPDVELTDGFAIDQGCNPGFAPTALAGTVSPQAGSYSPFTLTLSRQDSDQELAGLTTTLPQGLLAKLAGVQECSDAAFAAAAANASGASERANPSCPAGARVGGVVAGAGVGPNPFFLPGNAYLMGPYKGAPYSLGVVVPAVAGPFDLGTVAVRTALQIDKRDAHVTAVTDPFPTIVDARGANGHTDGFPIRLRRIDVTLDRPSFTLNPTSCSAQRIGLTVSSTSGAQYATGSQFQTSGCRALPFKPTLVASTQAHTSKANGASLKVKVTQKPGEASIHRVDLTLPRVLPSRLTTLQKACTEAQFAANPAGCPAASVIGSAKALTPLLDVPLTGPAYLVSHGGEAFPDVVFLLQGSGITLELVGGTQIKGGVTYSKFETVPDAPISSFETTLPEGPHSILTANASLCAKRRP